MQLATEAALSEGQEQSNNIGFKPGNIHVAEKIKYWESELKAGDWVLGVLRNGYILPLEKAPPEGYEEENNSSARKNMSFVRETVTKWAEQGIVKLTETKPQIVSPLSVVSRTQEDGTLKQRLCWDGSRCMNQLLKKQPVALAHLQRALEATEEGDWQAKYDLQSAYFHIRISEKHWKYLGAKFTDEAGRNQYFVFCHMPFGLATAVHLITKLFKPINAYLGQKGIRHTIFIDDGRVLAQSKQELDKHFEIVRQVVMNAGWIMEESKTDGRDGVSQIKEYLGFIIDTQQMSVKLTNKKKAELSRSLEEVMSARNRFVPTRFLASVIGKAIASEPATGPLVQVMLRRAYGQLEEHVQKEGWKTTIKVSEEIAEDFTELQQRVRDSEGYPIRTEATNVSVVSIIGEPSEFLKTKVIRQHLRQESREIWCGDASAVAVCAYSCGASEPFYFIGKLSEEEQESSSGQRELLTVKYALEQRLREGRALAKAATMYWLTDSENLVSFLTKGSRKRHIQALVLQVLDICKRLNLAIIPIHLRREDPRIRIADEGSKVPDSDDWSIDQEHFEKFNKEYGPFTVDLFADESNFRVKKFYANYRTPRAAGVNAFCHSWDAENAWICPPGKKIIQVIRKIRLSSGRGLLIVPEWPTAAFWPFLIDAKGEPHKPFKELERFRPKVVQNQRARSPISGNPAFSFLALHYDTRGY